ncbi:allantoinase AllB [Planctomonas psychrotolerans]|uniref:allantoinase AllB n=1 Tax=Planctomonas psychrotolerans TaxID=2528712 RepID=UPI001239D175|nr:allantoinase AllB [Planctomonas psychrotolerans]
MTDDLDLVLRADRVLIDDGFRPAAVGVRDGTVVFLGSRDAAIRGKVEHDLADDEVLLPGNVDSHVHVNEPGRTEWEGFTTATRAAAAGGVTTIIDMPLNSIPATVTPLALAEKRSVAGAKAIVDVGFWAGAVPQNLGSLRALHDDGVFGFKCFLAPSGVDEFDHLSTPQLHAAQAEIAAFDGLLLVHAEDPGVLDASANSGGPRFPDFMASRPPEAETTAIAAVIDGVRRTGARSHILHLAAAAALPALATARAEGLPITVETCPHYLTLDDGDVADGATQFKCCPPIRDEANRDALWQGLLDGIIDCVVSDHSPATADLKFVPGGDFGRAWGGIAGLQLGLPAVWTEARRRGIPIESVSRWMSRNPADLVRLPTKGRIAAGARADLVAFAPDETFRVDAVRLQHRNPVSAYDGRELSGIVRRAWLGGRPLDTTSPMGNATQLRPETRTKPASASIRR